MHIFIKDLRKQQRNGTDNASFTTKTNKKCTKECMKK